MKVSVEYRSSWDAPKEDGAPILCMPNIPKPIQGDRCQPRSIMGRTAWDLCRKKTYYLANYKSQISGIDLSAPGQSQCHELFSYNYTDGLATFDRYVCISPLEHIYFIHSGRALTFYKKGDFRYSAKKLLEGAENGFRLIHEWNQAHPDEPQLKPYATFVGYLDFSDLAPTMEHLIEKYKISFWAEDPRSLAEWGKWRVRIGNREYPTPYKDHEAWEQAMEKRNVKETKYVNIMNTKETRDLQKFIKEFEDVD